MQKLKAIPTQLILWTVNCRLWLLLWYSLYHRRACLYRSAGLFRQISRLTQRRKRLEQKLTMMKRGSAL